MQRSTSRFLVAMCFVLAINSSILTSADEENVKGRAAHESATEAPASDRRDVPKPSSDDRSTKDGKSSETISSVPIDDGLFLLDGRYVAPPYVISQSGEDVLHINDCAISLDGYADRFFGQRRGPGGRTGKGPRGGGGRMRGEENRHRSFLFRRFEERFQFGGLLIVLHEELIGFVPEGYEAATLEILLSDATREAKVESLMQEDMGRFSSAEWSRIVETFKPTTELAERARPLIAEEERLRAENYAAIRRNAILSSATVRYGVTVFAMALAVVALGSLLNHRPKTEARWSEFDRDGDGLPMVMRNVILLVILSGFDLALTLVAQQAGGFLELNPLGNELVKSPVYLASFKTVALLTACFILVVLRRYRGAQIASWWLCLVCTMLTFRWFTYNSMFLA